MKNKHWLISLGIFVVFLVTGIVLGFTLKENSWPSFAMPLLCITLGIVFGAITTAIFVSIKEQNSIILKPWLLFISIVIKFIATEINAISSVWAFFSFMWILAIVPCFPVIGIAVALAFVVVPILLIITIICFVGVCISSPVIMFFMLDPEDSEPFAVRTHIISIVFAFALAVSNILVFQVVVPNYQARTYTITYIAPEGAKVSDSTNSGYNKYYFNRGADERFLYTASMKGYKFVGWYYDEELTIPFETFKAYEKHENITLYAKFELAELSLSFDKNAFDFSGSTAYFNYDFPSATGQLNQEVTLPTLTGLPENVRFIGYTEEDISYNEFLSGDYTLINSIYITEDMLSTSKYVKVYPLFIVLPKEELKLDTITALNDSSYTIKTQKGFYVDGSSQTEYTLFMNHGDSYDRNSWDADYFEAIVYLENGQVIKILSSNQNGGNFTVPANTNFYIRFNDLTFDSKYKNSCEYERADILLVEGKYDASKIGNLTKYGYGSKKDLNTNSKIRLSSFTTETTNDDVYSMYGFTGVYTYNGEVQEFGVALDKTLGNSSYVYATITIFKNGKVYDSKTVKYTSANGTEYLKILDCSELENGQYEFVFTVVSDTSLFNNVCNFIKK